MSCSRKNALPPDRSLKSETSPDEGSSPSTYVASRRILGSSSRLTSTRRLGRSPESGLRVSTITAMRAAPRSRISTLDNAGAAAVDPMAVRYRDDDRVRSFDGEEQIGDRVDYVVEAGLRIELPSGVDVGA